MSGLFGLQCGEDENVLVTDFLATLDDRARGLLSPLFYQQGQRLEEFLTNSRQDVVELLREFNVSSLPPISEIRALIVSVARYSLLEGPRAAILSHAGWFSKRYWQHVFPCNRRNGVRVVPATAAANI